MQMFEDYYGPPFYTDLYNFKDGAQDDIFVDSYAEIPPPSDGSTVVPTPIAHPTGSVTQQIPTATATSGTTSSQPTSPTNNTTPSGGNGGKKHWCVQLFSANDEGDFTEWCLHLHQQITYPEQTIQQCGVASSVSVSWVPSEKSEAQRIHVQLMASILTFPHDVRHPLMWLLISPGYSNTFLLL